MPQPAVDYKPIRELEPNEPRVDDVMIDRLLDEVTSGRSLKAAEAKVNGLSKSEQRMLRIRCKKDLFFLCYGILGNNRLSPRFHGHLCTHIAKTNDERFREYLMARGHFKSTIISIGHSIQVVLPIDPEDLEYDGWWFGNSIPDWYVPGHLAWPDILGTDARLLIAHETHESAARFLYAIANHYTTNPALMGLFPEAVPTPRKHRINKWELELPRSAAATGNPEPTIDTLGVGGKSQGRHYNYIKLDDIFGDKARDSEAEAETTRQWFDNIQSFFSVFNQDKLDLTGTRYSYDDVYGHAHERYGKKLIKYIRKVEEILPGGKVTVDPVTGKEEPEKYIPFSEEFDAEGLAILKKNKKVYNAQYLNDPDENTTGFDQTWLRYFYWISKTQLVIFTGKTREVIDIRDLDICILIDPGESKSGGYCVTGMDHKYRVFVLSSLRMEMNPPELTDFQFRNVIQWQPRITSIESDFFMSVFEAWWQREMQVRGIRFAIYQFKTLKRQKKDRIDGLANYFAGEQIYLNEAQDDLIHEFRVYGKSKDIHIFDALAQGPEVWRPGYVPGTRAVLPSITSEQDTSDRDVETGYSAI